MSLVRHYREGNRDGDKFEKPLANSFARAIPCSRSSPLGAAVRHADRHRHELVRTGKLCANCDVALATARCSYLTELQMGYLHEKVHRLRRRYVPQEELACVQ